MALELPQPLTEAKLEGRFQKSRRSGCKTRSRRLPLGSRTGIPRGAAVLRPHPDRRPRRMGRQLPRLLRNQRLPRIAVDLLAPGPLWQHRHHRTWWVHHELEPLCWSRRKHDYHCGAEIPWRPGSHEVIRHAGRRRRLQRRCALLACPVRAGDRADTGNDEGRSARRHHDRTDRSARSQPRRHRLFAGEGRDRHAAGRDDAQSRGCAWSRNVHPGAGQDPQPHTGSRVSGRLEDRHGHAERPRPSAGIAAGEHVSRRARIGSDHLAALHHVHRCGVLAL